MAKGPFITPAERAKRVKMLLKVRKDAGMEGHTIYWLGEVTGVHRNHLYKLFNPDGYGTSANPNLDTLQRIAKALGVKPEELIAPAPGEGGSVPQFAQATSTLDGKTRIVVDAEVDAETGLQILQLVRKAQQQSSTKRSAS